MVYPQVPPEHSEFGGGPGLIDPKLRAARVVTPEEELIEIYATNPADPDAEQATSDIYYGETPEGSA